MAGPLVMLPSVHLQQQDGLIRMDDKFVAGLDRFAEGWGGPVRLVMRRSGAALPFSRPVDPADLPCALDIIDAHAPIPDEALRGASVVLATADDHRQLDLAPRCRTAGVPLVYAIEYTLRTRLAVAAVDHARNPLRLARSWQWLAAQEIRLRRALRAASGLQANGYPAMAAYGGLNARSCLYLDSRSRPEDMATEPEMQARADHRGPLRILYSGRLVGMKGTADLVPIAAGLRDRGVAFTLDIFGAGPMRAGIEDRIRTAGLSDRVRLHDPVDYRTGLVPWMRTKADLFLATHRQSDPSCSYLEAMACGVPVLGTDNRMWSEMARRSGGGWVGPMGRPGDMAAIIAGLDRGRIAQASAKALAFAREHDFDHEFARRIRHLRQVAGLEQ